MRRIAEYSYTGKGNSLNLWWKVSNPVRTVVNTIVLYSCKLIPSLGLKRFFYRLLGMKVGKGVSIALGAMFDIFFPDLITIGDNSIIGYNTTILCHEFLIKKWRRGEVRIGNNVMLGAQCLVMPGVAIGDGATVAAYSLVNKDVPAGQFWGGVPARKLG